MPRNYQVFIGEGRVSFTTHQQTINNSIETVLIDPSKKELQTAIEEMENTPHKNVLVWGDVNRNWKLFNSNYSLIEAAGGMVRNKNNQWLFIHRNGKWDLPKGKLEKGETPEIAATREVSEEGGIAEPAIGKKLLDTYHTYILNEQPILKKTYWYLMDSDDDSTPKPQEEEGIDKVVWVGKSEIPKLLENTYGNIELVVKSVMER